LSRNLCRFNLACEKRSSRLALRSSPFWQQVFSVLLIVVLFLAVTPSSVQATPTYDPVFYYYHGDHLGSPNVLTDCSGNIVQHYEYYVFGGELHRDNDSAFPVSNRYTDQILDYDTGLYYYGARYYDPEIGRFVQPDPIVPAVGDSQSLNRYSYVRNNPLKRIDPSGLYDLSSPDPFDVGSSWYSSSLGSSSGNSHSSWDTWSGFSSGFGSQDSSGWGSSGNSTFGGGFSSSAFQYAPFPSITMPGLALPSPSDQLTRTGARFQDQYTMAGYQGGGPGNVTDLVPVLPNLERAGNSFLDRDYGATVRYSVAAMLDVGLLLIPGGRMGEVGAAAKEAVVVEQYSLRATQPGFYPVMKWGFKEPQAGIWLEAGDVWKYGTTMNPATRYSGSFLDQWGLRYNTESIGTLQEALTVEKMKILNYRDQCGVLPPGNKMVK
jgi:RHS repeat-associated protein